MSCEMEAQAALATIAGARTLAQLEACSRAVWPAWSAGRLSDAQAQSLAEAIEARRRAVRGLDTVAIRVPTVAAAAQAVGRPRWFPPKRKRAVSPDRRASLERRRLLAASGVMPPALASRFTVGELAALRIVADEVRDKGACRLPLGAIAARAGIGATTARNGLREAAAQGLLTIEERRRRGPNLPNVVRVISAEWIAWIVRGGRAKAASPSFEGGGSKKPETTGSHSYRMKSVARVSRRRHHPSSPRRPLPAATSG